MQQREFLSAEPMGAARRRLRLLGDEQKSQESLAPVARFRAGLHSLADLAETRLQASQVTPFGGGCRTGDSVLHCPRRMLRHLHIENYALIDSLDIEFHSGFNSLTGETGSGKSIVVDAVGLLLGAKASPELIRAETERAHISGIFSPNAGGDSTNLPGWKRLVQHLAECGIEVPEEELVIQRDILAGGKSRAFVNHQPATVSLLRQLSPYLAEVHGQNEQQELLSPASQLEMLDRFGGLMALASNVGEFFRRWKELRTKQENLVRNQQERLRQLDLWHFQKREMEQAAVESGEDQRLEAEKLVLAHAARIQSNLAAAYNLLYDSSQSAAASLTASLRNLEEVSGYDASLKPLSEALLSAKASTEDIALSLRDRLSRLEASPERLEEVESRLAALDRLKRKYGPTLDEVLRYRAQVGESIHEAESSEERSQALEQQVLEAADAYDRAAQELSRQRRNAAQQLKKAVEKELGQLAMKGTVFAAELSSVSSPEDWRASGLDQVEFRLSPNPGEPLRPLAKIASGGEISRIMLALEIVADARQSARAADHTLIFDEVDAGIGGRAAEMVGRKLRQLGERRQVLCVTHLAQIASFAQHHFRVEKSERGGRTTTLVQYLGEKDRAEELARMLSGTRITEAVLQHARQLLKGNC
ncbi:MAG TPA: DNA repair protein RecN [Candidatus Glassbacteria bacterium]|nr:DNA repair protein RecN [Candidatus Glassbacteria bacterium]